MTSSSTPKASVSSESVAVIIVNYNAGALVAAGLQALQAQRQALGAGADVRVVVVDNASTDDSLARLAAAELVHGWGGWVHLVAHDANAGFAAGNNLGVQHAQHLPGFQPKHFFFLNPDACLGEGALRALLRASEHFGHGAILGAQLTNEDGSERGSAFRFPGILSEFQRGTGMGWLQRLLPGSRILVPPQGMEPQRVDWVSGAAFWVPAKIWKRVGPMNESYFLYYEEVDFMRRAKYRSVDVWTVPAARVAHAAGASTGIVGGEMRGRVMPTYWYHSWHRYFFDNHGRMYASLCGAAWMAGRALRVMYARLRGQPSRLDDGHAIARFAKHALPAPPLRASRSVPGKAPPLPNGARDENPPGMSLFALWDEDFRTHDSCWGSQGFWALTVHRFGNWRMSVRSKLLRMPLTLGYRVLRKLVQIVCGIKLDYTVQVGRRVKIEHFGGMILGARSIGDDVIIRQNTTIGVRNVHDLNAKPAIGSRVDIGAGAVLVGNIRIGDDVVIGANAVVSFDVPDGARVRPARSELIVASDRAARSSVFGDLAPVAPPLHAGTSRGGAGVNSQFSPL